MDVALIPPKEVDAGVTFEEFFKNDVRELSFSSHCSMVDYMVPNSSILFTL